MRIALFVWPTRYPKSPGETSRGDRQVNQACSTTLNVLHVHRSIFNGHNELGGRRRTACSTHKPRLFPLSDRFDSFGRLPRSSICSNNTQSFVMSARRNCSFPPEMKTWRYRPPPGQLPPSPSLGARHDGLKSPSTPRVLSIG